MEDKNHNHNSDFKQNEDRMEIEDQFDDSKELEETKSQRDNEDTLNIDDNRRVEFDSIATEYKTDDSVNNVTKENVNREYKNIENKNVLKENGTRENDTRENDIRENNTKENDTKENDTKENETNYMKEMREMFLYFAGVIIIVLLIHQFVGQQIEVSGSSMESTLHNEDHLILEKVSYRVGEPKRFDIVVFRPYAIDEDVYYIKRVIGLPGETIQIIGSDIYINGEILEEDYGNNPIIDGGIARNIIELKDDEYFLLGDNRNNSKDSRDSSIGSVQRDAILGRAWVRIWPIDNFGVLEHQ